MTEECELFGAVSLIAFVVAGGHCPLFIWSWVEQEGFN